MSRRRARVAMVGVPIVSHVLPSLALIRELVARGHRVTYANDPSVADRIESVGAEPVPCTSTLPVADNDWPADPIAAASLFLDDAVQALPQLRAAYDDDPADLYLYGIGAHAERPRRSAGPSPRAVVPDVRRLGRLPGRGRRASAEAAGRRRVPGQVSRGGSPTAGRAPRMWTRSPARPPGPSP